MKILLPLLFIVALAAASLYFIGSDGIQKSSDSDMMQLGNFAYQEKRFEDAFAWYEDAAKQDIAEGQFHVYQMYQAGEGVDKDEVLATEWLAKAASHGLPQAEFEYATALEFGRGTNRETIKKVVPWYQRAAQHGHPEASLKVAQLYFNGRGVEQNTTQAMSWALKAKEKGVPHADTFIKKVIKDVSSSASDGNMKDQHAIAMMYLGGHGVKKDTSLALFWLQKAAKRGSANAQYDLGKILIQSKLWSKSLYWLKKSAQQGHIQAGYLTAAISSKVEQGDTAAREAWRWLYYGKQLNDPKVLYNLATFLNTAQLNLPQSNFNHMTWLKKAAQGGVVYAQNDYAAELIFKHENTKQAVYWLKKAAQTDAKAQFNLGFIYARGDDITPNDDAAIQWWRRAEKNNNAHAKMMLGLFYNLGRGVGRSEKDAVTWYLKASQQGELNAIYNLGILYYNGRGIDRDYKKAAQYFSQLAKHDDAAAQNIYASLFLEGQGVKYSPETAVKWFQKAAEAGNKKAMFNLATQYRTGNGIQQNDKKALFWYKKSAEYNFAAAQNAVGYMYAQGRGTKTNKDTAEIWFQKASDNGLRMAINNANALKQQGSFSLLRLQIDNQIRSKVLTDKNLDLSKWVERHAQAVF